MRKVLTTLLLAVVLFITAFQPAAFAEPDLAIGAKVFSANCAACHMGGGNVVAANKNLKADTLKQYGMDSAEAVINQVTNGKSAMPAFKSRLTAEQIESVAAYVLAQAEKSWTK